MTTAQQVFEMAIALMDSMILAQWMCGQKTKQTVKRQKISY
jgi:hypothetical protein